MNTIKANDSQEQEVFQPLRETGSLIEGVTLMKKYDIWIRSESTPPGGGPFLLRLNPITQGTTKTYDTQAALSQDLAACGVDKKGFENVMKLLAHQGQIQTHLKLTPESVYLLSLPA
jgi:hypothetical protein